MTVGQEQYAAGNVAKPSYEEQSVNIKELIILKLKFNFNFPLVRSDAALVRLGSERRAEQE